jgi:[acyl-carrier-protein] S-malonyltransferase
MTALVNRTAFLFPGQGAQHVGMGREPFDQVPAARELFERASGRLGYDLAALCFDGPAEKLDATEFSQPALFVTSMAAVERLRSESPHVVQECTLAAGLSLGEYSALTFAGALDFDSGLELVAERGRAMQAAAEATAGGMVSVLGLERAQVEDLCSQARDGEVLQLANLLCPGNIVVSGHKEACERLTRLAEAAGAMKVVPLSVAGAFHTPLMESARERLRIALERVEFRRPKIRVISNVDASPHEDPLEIRDLLLAQLVSPVLWADSMRSMIQDHSVTQFYELGAGRVLRGLLKRIDRRAACENM